MFKRLKEWWDTSTEQRIDTLKLEASLLTDKTYEDARLALKKDGCYILPTLSYAHIYNISVASYDNQTILDRLEEEFDGLVLDRYPGISWKNGSGEELFHSSLSQYVFTTREYGIRQEAEEIVAKKKHEALVNSTVNELLAKEELL